MLENKPLSLNSELAYALDQLEYGTQPVFISGRAGTGKSTLLQLYRNTSRKRIAVVAPTGVAALNVKGQTIHSFFRFPPRLLQKSDIRRQRNYRLYENLEVLVVDEVSMVRADQFDLMDHFLRINRKNDQPFGGVRILLFGDLFQLPPVVASNFEKEYLRQHYESPYFFSSSVYAQLKNNLELIELRTVYRQKEAYFIRMLDNIRQNCLDPDDLSELNRRIVPYEDRQANSITLTTRNEKVRQINARELSRLDTAAHDFLGSVEGNFDARNYPTNARLVLKEGAQVMMLRNDPDRRYVNGSLGKITFLDHQTIRVRLSDYEDQKDIEVEQFTWEMIKYTWDESKKQVETQVTGSFRQYPMKLAWAVTIHKSQGQSFDRLYLDMDRGAFETGQTYVALSRCTSLSGLQLKQALKFSDIMVDERITDYYAHWR